MVTRRRNRRRFFILISLLLIVSPLTAGFDHSSYDAILKKHVNDQGMVDYKGLLKNRKPLDDYIRQLGNVKPADLESWNTQQQFAFWINAYNAITLLRIIDHYPPKGWGILGPKISIKNIDGVWDEIKTRVAGRELTLDQIEHEILRPEFGDPRLHAAIVCAAKSCPVLENEAYLPGKLDQQLNHSAERWINDPTKNLIDTKNGEVQLSPIFEWFKDDFKAYKQEVPNVREVWGLKGELSGGIGFMTKFGDRDKLDFLKRGDYRVKVAEYDWSLNEQ